MPKAAGRFGQLPLVWISVLIVLLDRLSKNWFDANLLLYDYVPVIPNLFGWTLAYNTGAAFSFLAEQGGWQRWFFAGVAVFASVSILIWLLRLGRTQRWLAIALALVLGGALGNLYDRIVLGHVVDFILVHWQDRWFFPAFNIADCAISVGAAMLIIDMFFSKKEQNND